MFCLIKNRAEYTDQIYLATVLVVYIVGRQLQYEYVGNNEQRPGFVIVCVGDQIMRPAIADEMMAQYVSIGHESLQLGWQRSFSHLDRGSVSMSEARKWL